MPVHALLGTEREQVKVYISTSFDIGGRRECAARSRELGFRGFRIHPYIDAPGPE